MQDIVLNDQTLEKNVNVPDVNVPDVNVPVNRLTRIIQMIEENNRVTVSNIATECRVNEKTIKRDIEKLKNQGILCRIGSSNSGYWQIIETKK